MNFNPINIENLLLLYPFIPCTKDIRVKYSKRKTQENRGKKLRITYWEFYFVTLIVFDFRDHKLKFNSAL